MAKKSAPDNNISETQGSDGQDDSKPVVSLQDTPPDGFTIPVGRDRGDGWVDKFVGAIVQGKLLGLHTMKKEDDGGKKRKYFQVELTRPCHAIQVLTEDDDGYDEDAEDGNRVEVELKAGDILNVDVSVGLRDLEPHFTDGRNYEVWLQFVRQDKKFRNMWRFKGPFLKPLNR